MSPDPVYALLREIAGERLSLRVNGGCMSDVLPSGCRIEIRRTRMLLPGDIVVIPAAGVLLVHRVIGGYRRRGVTKVLTQADRGTGPDMAVPVSEVLGRVVAVDGPPLNISPGCRIRSLMRFLGFAWERMRNA
jgi:hypothetical protein